MDDVTQLLEQDHRTVESLFADYDDVQDATTLEQICQELRSIRPSRRRSSTPAWPNSISDLEQHAEEEHAEAKDLIAQI